MNSVRIKFLKNPVVLPTFQKYPSNWKVVDHDDVYFDGDTLINAKKGETYNIRLSPKPFLITDLDEQLEFLNTAMRLLTSYKKYEHFSRFDETNKIWPVISDSHTYYACRYRFVSDNTNFMPFRYGKQYELIGKEPYQRLEVEPFYTQSVRLLDTDNNYIDTAGLIGNNTHVFNLTLASKGFYIVNT